ncbi:LLM class flavin-dependent oxidoreductase [Pseudoteredinibacter isoporae]|uniref:Luciferase family oxidoreductase group 1 n=1 Tax=Pseudoteredinibacter isoporae TaxID=570281 RepID=A0A7X0JQS6_9GAMM|nr:LLM class flavin-dependent oxidoreductase [Pseudoteredinibacter isoporae]MBB6520587.1 luciferase family oxidoreductase group 1 [Pseudoteredinibacter isoporae]NHO86154.1 LLM class flavin-dependent oxidoreductase [Pseudoteredinibacter isoporae]NIB25395.1 LLM class flavin-dependent oxidoreductase [Pseudoteredinibacter isoporae]
MKLSVLDQSPLRKGGSAEQAFSETLALAKFVEALGFERFWVSEHHGTDALAGSAPEVLLGALGASTERIRIGSGGIMLPHYTPYKIAEVAATLSALNPGRIDLGIGRAPGTDMVTARLLAQNGQPDFSRFHEQSEQLQTILHDKSFQPKLRPQAEIPADVWMLGSSPDSAALAGQLGLPYNFALFINPAMDGRILEYYRHCFQREAGPGRIASPHSCLTVNVLVADTEEQAHYLARSRLVSYLKFIAGKNDTEICHPDEAALYSLSPQEDAFAGQRMSSSAIGTAEQVKEKLLSLADEYGADEIMTVTICYDFEDRKRSYQLLAEAFGLS